MNNFSEKANTDRFFYSIHFNNISGNTQTIKINIPEGYNLWGCVPIQNSDCSSGGDDYHFIGMDKNGKFQGQSIQSDLIESERQQHYLLGKKRFILEKKDI